MRLLIAEDQRDLTEALTFLFEKNQFTVDAVYDGRSEERRVGKEC